MSQQGVPRPEVAVAPLGAFKPRACRARFVGSPVLSQRLGRRVAVLAVWERAGVRVCSGCAAVEVVRLVSMDLAEHGRVENGSEGTAEHIHYRAG